MKAGVGFCYASRAGHGSRAKGAMKLYSLLNENHVLIGEPVTSCEAALRRMLQAFADSTDRERHEEIVHLLLEREEQHPTFLADGICIPHARLQFMDRFLLGLLVPEKPFAHVDPEEPAVTAMWVILAPQDKNTMMLQTLAAVARLLKSRETRQVLPKLKSAQRLIRLVEESRIDVKKTLVASDVMNPITQRVTDEMVLAAAIEMLVDAPDEGVPVVSDSGRLLGELTSRELLALGMPKYVDLLVNPVMLESFEPFEAFFQHENTMTVREVYRRDVISVPPTAPIVQVTHLMMTRQKRRIYVVDEGQLLGVILRKDIVARVLHF